MAYSMAQPGSNGEVYMYQHLTKLFLAVLVAAVLSLAALGQASAQGTPDFSECVELRGPALGLCEAGVQIDLNRSGFAGGCLV